MHFPYSINKENSTNAHGVTSIFIDLRVNDERAVFGGNTSRVALTFVCYEYIVSCNMTLTFEE